MSGQALLPANMGDLCWSCDFVRLRIFPFWMACSREGHSFGHRTVQLIGIKRPSIPWRVPAFSRCRTCVFISITIHGCRVPIEGRVHGRLVDTISAGV